MRHRFHALCPYFAMFPEAFAELWISRLSRPGDTILDPFSGRGTAAFQAVLMNRAALAVDVSPVAFAITRAKTNSPLLTKLLRRLSQLEREFVGSEWESIRAALPEFFHFAYDRSTLRQILFLRNRLRWANSENDCMLAALMLGALHGESDRSSSYLSNQMPHAISTKPAYSIRYWKAHGSTAPKRDVFELLRNRIAYRYVSSAPDRKATVFLSDMRNLPCLVAQNKVPLKCVVTSPPYFDVTNFEEDQWLRNWFMRGPPHPTYRRLTSDNRHLRADRYWGLISDMWRVLGAVLSPKANIVVRFGTKRMDPRDMVRALGAAGIFAHRKVRLASHEISEIRNRQTDTFRPGSSGCLVEVDCHFVMS